MRGEAKRDYPASISFQSPWWELYGKVEEYLGRVTAAMTRGQEVRDLLVLHPVESMWTLFSVGWMKQAGTREQSAATRDYDRMFWELTEALLAENLDFDYGDEELLARHGSVRRQAGAARLKVGQALYKAVIVPPLRTMRASTVALLERFRAAGGTVVFAGPAPAYVDARPSSAAQTFAAACPQAPAKGPQLAHSVEAVSRRVSILDPQGRQIIPALHLLREDRDALYLFVCNMGEDFVNQARSWREDPPVRERRLAFPTCAFKWRPPAEARRWSWTPRRAASGRPRRSRRPPAGKYAPACPPWAAASSCCRRRPQQLRSRAGPRCRRYARIRCPADAGPYGYPKPTTLCSTARGGKPAGATGRPRMKSFGWTGSSAMS